MKTKAGMLVELVMKSTKTTWVGQLFSYCSLWHRALPSSVHELLQLSDNLNLLLVRKNRLTHGADSVFLLCTGQGSHVTPLL